MATDAQIVQRFDVGQGATGARRRTPQGGLIVDAKVTRAGVFSYTQPDGSVQRELRHPDEVFAADSLATLEHAPVTIDHPAAVTPDNWRSVAVGHVASAPKRDGIFVDSPLRIHDGGAIAKAEAGDLTELSCGYSCHLDRTAGSYEGEPYDAIQRTIRYNHVAAGPKGWGRAGPEVRMRLDAGAAVSGVSYVPAVTTQANSGTQAGGGSAGAAATQTAATAGAGAGQTASTDRSDALERVVGENAVLRAENARLTTELAAAIDPKRFDAAVDARVAIVHEAAAVLGKDWKHDGKTAPAIHREVLAKLSPTLKTDGADWTDAMLAGAYRTAIAGGARTDAGRQALGAALPGIGNMAASDRADAEDDPLAKATAEQRKRSANGWRTDRTTTTKGN